MYGKKIGNLQEEKITYDVCFGVEAGAILRKVVLPGYWGKLVSSSSEKRCFALTWLAKTAGRARFPAA